jgi:hypothetical protein
VLSHGGDKPLPAPDSLQSTALPASAIPPPTGTRAITYTYVTQQLTGAAESPGNSDARGYHPAGNRTSVTINGIQQAACSHNAANQAQGWTFNPVRNLTGDGATGHGFDAPGRLSGTTALGQTRGFAYNGACTLVSQVANGTTTLATRASCRREARKSSIC